MLDKKASNKTVKLFLITAVADVNPIRADLHITAESLEDALARSKDLKTTDFMDFKGESGWIDGEMRIDGVFEAES